MSRCRPVGSSRSSVARLTILDSAIQDILELTDYLSEFSEATADKLTDALADCFEQLGEFPELGRARPEIDERTRSFALNRVRVTVFYLYERSDDVVMIAHVYRQERGAQ